MRILKTLFSGCFRWRDLAKCTVKRFGGLVYADLTRGLHEALELALIGAFAAACRLFGRLRGCLLLARHQRGASVAQAHYMTRRPAPV